MAQLISYTFHPGILPTLGAAMLMVFSGHVITPAEFYKTLGIVVAGTYFLPTLCVLVFKKMGYIDSIHMVKRKDRVLPYFAGAMLAFASAKILPATPPFIEVVLSLYAASFIVIMSMALLPFWKSSAHMAGIMGLVALTTHLVETDRLPYPAIILTVLAAGAVSWARLYLKRHTAKELISGAVIGFTSLYLVLG